MFKIQWLVEKKIVSCFLQGDILIDELRIISDQLEHHFDQSDNNTVHVLVDRTKLNSLPLSLKSIQNLGYHSHQHLGWHVIFNGGNGNHIVEITAGILATYFHNNYRSCETLEQSVAFLAQVDSSLPSTHQMISKWNELHPPQFD